MTDYENVYKAFFDESFGSLASCIDRWRSGDGSVVEVDRKVHHDMNLFDPTDQRSIYYTYDRMVRSTQRLMSGHLEGLIRSMLDADGRRYATGEAFTQPGGYRRRWVPLVIDIDGRKTGLVFSDINSFPMGAPRAGEYDELLFVVATRTKKAAIFPSGNQSTRRVDLEELFEILFPGEYELFLDYVDAFNERAKELIAFSLIEQPTEDRMPDVRAKCLERLRSDVESMRDDLSTGIYLRDWEGKPVLEGPGLTDQVDVLCQRFLGMGTCRVMVGTRDFADSYVSSEWLYQINELTRTLEQTGTAVGYIKSVEQLLYDVALLFMEDEIYAMNWRDKTGADRHDLWNKAFPDSDRLTLWSLIDFFSEDTNLGILSLDPPFDATLQQVLHSFRAEDRNEYLHKANLIGNDGLRSLFEVRRKAELIYLLVLGGCSISDSSLSQLGLRREPVATDGREIVSEWARRTVRLQAFRRDAALADGVELELMVDEAISGARRALGQKEGEYWRLSIELHDRGMRFMSSALGQAYELPLRWHGREEWEDLAVWVKLTLEGILAAAGVTGRTGSPLAVSVSYSHVDSGNVYEYLVNGPVGTSMVDKELLQLPSNSKKSRGE